MIFGEALRVVSQRAVFAAERKIETSRSWKWASSIDDGVRNAGSTYFGRVNSGQGRNQSVAKSPTANATALSAINLFID